MTRLVYLIGLFLLVTQLARGQNTNRKEDTNTLDALATRYVKSEIEKLPSVIRIKVFLDGNPVDSGFMAVMLSLNKKPKSSTGDLIRLKMKDYAKSDSAIIWLSFANYNILTNKFPVFLVKYGGTLSCGIITDYGSERSKYTQDSNSYLQKNDANFLYETMILISKTRNEWPANSKLLYSFLQTNASTKVRFKYEFMANGK